MTRLKEESMDGLPPPPSLLKKVAVIERWPLWIVGCLWRFDSVLSSCVLKSISTHQKLSSS